MALYLARAELEIGAGRAEARRALQLVGALEEEGHVEHGRLAARLLAPELEQRHVPGRAGHGEHAALRAHGQLLDGQVRLGELRRHRSVAVGPLRARLVENFARLEPVEHLERERGRVPKLDRPVRVPGSKAHVLCKVRPARSAQVGRVPGDDDLRVTGRQRAPLAAAHGPLALAEPAVARGADRVQRRDEVAGAVGHVQAARDRRLVDVHRVRVLEAREAGREQVHDHEVVLQHDDDRVRLLDFCAAPKRGTRA